MAPEVEREDRLDAILASYLKAVENGAAPPRQALLDSNPDLAVELADFFADQERVRRLAAPLRAAIPPPFPPRGWGRVGVGLPHLRDFGDYELQEEIARGGMGVVFKAWQKSLNRVVALKMLLAGPLASADDLRRFRAEAESAARLDHPHIVPIHDVGVHDGHPYLSMKLLPGGSLAQAARPLRPRDAARLLAPVADAVHYAHQRGVLHRDLKPANILLDERGQPYVTDFGLAKQTLPLASGGRQPPDASRSHRQDAESGGLRPPLASTDLLTVPTLLQPPVTQTGAVVGTPAYMAPEQAAGDRDAVTTAADVYGLGAVLYELLTGRAPFRGQTAADTLRLVLETEAARPRALNPAVDRDLETICLKCLAKEPGRRYAGAADLAADLRRYLAGDVILARRAGRLERLWRSVRRHPVVSGLAAALALALATGFAVALTLWLRAEALYEDAKSQEQSLAVQAVALQVALGQERTAEEKATAETRKAEDKTREAEANYHKAHEAIRRMRKLSNDLDQTSGTQPLRRQLLQTVLDYDQDFLKQRGDDPALRRERADAQFDSAQIISAIGARADALAAYRDAAELYRELHEADPADVELQRCYINSLNNAGTLEPNIEASLAVFRQVRRLYEETLCFHPDDERLLNGLANALSNLGAGCLDAGRFDESRRCLEQSVEIQEPLLKANPFRIAFTHDLATTYTNLGTLYTRLPGRTKEALASYDRARDLHRNLAKAFPKDASRQADLAASLNSVGILLRDHGDKDEALKVLLQADAIRQKAADDNPSVVRFQIDLALSHGNVGVAYARKGDREKELVYHEKGRDLLDKLYRQDPQSIPFRKELAGAWYNISACHGAMSHWKEEYGALIQARDLQEQVVRDDPDNVNCRADLGRTVINLGLALHRLKRDDDAREVLHAGIASLREGLERSPQTAAGLGWLLNGQYVNLSLVERSAGRPDDAVAVTQERLKRCGNDANEWYRGALEFAATAPVYGQGSPDLSPEERAGRDRCADLAMEALRQAAANGFHDLGRLHKDAELDLLRARDDYRALIDALEKKELRPQTSGGPP